MKKVFGITFGGLQQKTIVLVLIMIVVTIAILTGVALYQYNQLTSLVEETRVEQQEAVQGTSLTTMAQTMDATLTGTMALYAQMGESEFTEVINYVRMMQTMAEGLLENRAAILPTVVPLPDPSRDGQLTAHAISEKGVDPSKSELMGILGHMSSSLVAMCHNTEKISSCFVGMSDGTHLSISANLSSRYDESGQLIDYPVRRRPWYVGAMETDDIFFTAVEPDAFTGELCVTCSAPVHCDGKIVAVVGADIALDQMLKGIIGVASDTSISFVMNNDGQVVLAPAKNPLFKVEASDLSVDLRTVANKPVADFAAKALVEPTGLMVANIRDRDFYMTGAPIPAIGWAVGLIVDKEVTEQPTKAMLAGLDSINSKASEAFRSGLGRSNLQTALLIGLTLLLGAGAAFVVGTRIVRPIEDMTRDITEAGETGKLFEMKDSYRTNDEIQVLAESFDDLSKKTRQYIEHITEITREKERISTELELARKIQADMLPYIYPAFPDRPEFDIFATMNPAREVGGDFYDFFLIDQDHLGMVVADVSGKGVPAALFMMMSKILISNFAMAGGTPAEVLEKTNNAICKNNEDEMFVTAWFGILEISTGKIIAANAGHEYPIIRNANGEFTLIKDRHGLVLGAMENRKYKDYELTLSRGGMLFLYTDGVPEATNKTLEMFGTKRLLDALNQSHAQDAVALLTAVRSAVSDFVDGTDQFDDLTMLGMMLR